MSTSTCNCTTSLFVEGAWVLLWVRLCVRLTLVVTACASSVYLAPAFACVLAHKDFQGADCDDFVCVCVCSLFEHAVFSEVGHLHLLWFLAVCGNLLHILFGPRDTWCPH